MAAAQSELQILSLAEQGLPASDISDTLGYDLETVQYVLARHGKLEDEEVSDDDFASIRRRLIGIAKESEDDILAARVSMFLWERKRGAIKDLKGGPTINVGKLNMLITGANSFVDTFRKRKNEPETPQLRPEDAITIGVEGVPPEDEKAKTAGEGHVGSPGPASETI